MMSVTKKRALSQELESGEAKRLVAPSLRPPKPPAKRRKTEESPGTTKCNYSGGDQRVVGKGKRQAWTATASEVFFEGLYQHGKYFHRILKYMQSKQKKLNDPLIPNLTKDQVRFFYYRTWHKVESHLDPTLQTACEHSKKTKQPQSSGDNTLGHTAAVAEEGENHTDPTVEECEVTELVSPKKPTELLLNGGGGNSNQTHPEEIGDLSSLSPTSMESSEKIKDQVGASPSASSDKGESKTKYVVVNGVKQSLDLVALICYHKLKQKCQVDHNFWKRLSELVYQGTTTIPSRVKGKRRIQIKVPNCGALRGKLTLPLMSEDPVMERVGENPDCDDAIEQAAEQGTSDRDLLETDLCLSSEGPAQITLELRPLTSASWAHVQGLSQNPRIRITIGSSRRLVELLQILSLRWKIDKATINIYHTYSKNKGLQTTIASKCPEEKESSLLSDCGVPKHLTPPCRDSNEKVQAGRINNEQEAADCAPLKVDGSEAQVGECLHRPCLNAATALCPSQATCTYTSTWQLEYNSRTTMRDIHNHFSRPDCVQLLYSIPYLESQDSVSHKLKVLLKIVNMITKEAKNKDDQDLVQSPKITRTPKKVMTVVHQSPKLVEYMKSLEKRSPRKSPLAKYHRLRVKSPYRIPVSQLKPKRVQLDFTTPPPASAASSSASVLSTMSISKASPEVIQLSKPNLPLTSTSPEMREDEVPCSFTTVRLSNVLSKVTDSSSSQPLKDNICTSNAFGVSFQETLSDSCVLPSSSTAGQSKQLPHLSTGAPKGHPLITQFSHEAKCQSQPPNVSMAAQSHAGSPVPITAIALQPGHRVLKPKQGVMVQGITVTPVTSSSTASGSPSVSVTRNIQVGSTCSQPSSPSSVAFVSALKPFSKPRRTKKTINRTGQTRQLVPRPLPFLPQPQASGIGHQSHQALLPPLPASLNLPLSAANTVLPGKDGPMSMSQNQNALVLTLLQAVMQQQKQLKQQLKLTSEPSTNSPSQHPQKVVSNICETDSVELMAHHQADDGVAGGLDQLLEFEEQATDSQGKVFNTSSDTVNNLLRGLSCTKESEAIKKLTEETANVLPTFAKALGQSTQAQSPIASEPSSIEKPTRADRDEIKVDASVQPLSDNELSMSELLGNISDSTFKQISDRDDVLENVNFGDVFSQLRGVLKSPEKLESYQEVLPGQQTKDQSDESMSSIGCLLDYLNSGEEPATSSEVGVKPTAASQMGDPTYRSLMEEGSVDYIQKFKELASSMDITEGI